MLSGAIALAFTGAALADDGAEHQVLQSRPILLGTTGSAIDFLQDKAFLYCYAGTLGSLVQDDSGTQYILSNNHVLAIEGQAGPNEPIIQPGLLDEGTCSLSSGNPDNIVGNLTRYQEILFGTGKNKPDNEIDAAIAEVVDVTVKDANGNDVTVPAVNTDGEILDVGMISTGGATDAAVNMLVQKSGRTTGHTFGNVLAVDVAIDVKYTSGTAHFINQMRIRHICDSMYFSAAGDSGSLIVNAPQNGPRLAVGLLFAGGDVDTFANPIASVLDKLSVTMVEGTTSVSETDTPPDCPVSSGGGGGGGGGGGNGHGPNSHSGFSMSANSPDIQHASAVKDRHAAALMALPGVVGHGVGADQNGAVIEVYVESRARRPVGIPAALEGVPVRVVETGPIRPF